MICRHCQGELGPKSAKGLCQRCYSREWKRTHPERVKELNKADHLKHREKRNRRLTERRRARRRQIVETLGAKCKCCGETEPVFLTIDHVQNDGAKVRTMHRHRLHTMILAEGCPPERYQILCWNCNAAKGILGACPHSTASSKKT